MNYLSKTPVQLLFEFSTKHNLPPPQFEEIETNGPSHDPTFRVRAYLAHGDGSVIAEGTGTQKKKKEAKHDAAVALLNKVKATDKPISLVARSEATNLSACWSKDYERSCQKPSSVTPNPSINTCRGDTGDTAVEALPLQLSKALNLGSSSPAEKPSEEGNHSIEHSYRNLALSSIDRSENDFLELCTLFHEINIGEEFKNMEDLHLSIYEKLGKLEKISCGKLKVIWSENGLKDEKKTAHSYYIKYKTATIAMTQENGLRIHSDKIREEAAKKAYSVLKMIFTNNPQLSTF